MIKYAIIENEEFARLNLIRTLSCLRPEYLLDFKGESIEDMIAYWVSCLRSDSFPDLFLMDIELVDGSCFEFFKCYDVATPVIFTTAYPDFALDSFRVNVVDYLLKPVTDVALQKALAKFEGRLFNSPYSSFSHAAGHESQILPVKKRRSRILVNIGDNYEWIDINDVACFIRDEKYIFVYTFKGKKYITDFQNLAEVLYDLEEDSFFQLSRNLIVSIKSIRKVSKWFGGRLKVTVGFGSETIETTVSVSRRPQLIKWLGGVD